MRRISLRPGWTAVVGLSVAVAASACTSKSAPPTDSTKTASPAQTSSARRGAPPTYPVTVDVSQLQDAGDIKQLHDEFADSHNTYTFQISSAGCPAGATLSFTAAKGEQDWEFTDYSNSGNTGAIIGRIVNTSNCTPDGALQIPPNTEVIAVVSATAPKNPKGKGPFLYLYNVTTGTDITGYRQSVAMCKHDPNHPVNGNQFGPKPTWESDSATLCDHQPPKQPKSKNRARAYASFDELTVWYGCGSDCCYGDDGNGLRDQGNDSTPPDSSHGDRSAPAKKAKAGSGAAN